MGVRHGRATVIGSRDRVESQVFGRLVRPFSGRVIPERFFAVSVSTDTQPTAAPATLSIPASLGWTALMIVAGLAVYYFVGVDQGMMSVFGANTDIHEFMHDARHFLGFPCH